MLRDDYLVKVDNKQKKELEAQKEKEKRNKLIVDEIVNEVSKKIDDPNYLHELVYLNSDREKELVIDAIRLLKKKYKFLKFYYEPISEGLYIDWTISWKLKKQSIWSRLFKRGK